MRPVALSLPLAILLLLPGLTAGARPWHGLTPGVTTKGEVIKKFGSPSRELPMSPRYASGIIYQQKEAQEYGAEEAQFFFDQAGKLTDIFVFPSVALKREDVIKAYGTAFEERRTDDFRLYFQYKSEGFVVFFDKDNESVYQLQFTAGTNPATPAATPPPAQQPKASASGTNTAQAPK